MKLSQSSQFRKDIRTQIRKGKDYSKVIKVVKILLAGNYLPARYKDHPLRGNWKGRRDCHIEPDWILIYKISDEQLLLERTGSHSDLF